MRLDFIKMHAAGNDYIFVDCLLRELKNPELIAENLCKRRFSVGADGLILLLPSSVADAKMRIFNADGSEAAMCGNASRCAARLLYESGFARKSRIRLETLSGIKEAYLTLTDGNIHSISIDMGRASVGEMFFFENAGEKFEMRGINVGNEHQVAFVPDADYPDLNKLGPSFEQNPRFADGVNTEICEILGKNHLKVRTYERGSGETLACGTGACAAAVAGILNGSCSTSKMIRISMRGGELGVICDEAFRLRLVGNATRVFDGVVEV